MKRTENPEVMRPSDWFVRPRSGMVARREDVWALLGWYHAKYVIPNQGLLGFLRRSWYRITGQRRELLKLTDPWAELRAVIETRRAARSLAHDLNRGDGSGSEEPGLELDEESTEHLGRNGDGPGKIIAP